MIPIPASAANDVQEAFRAIDRNLERLLGSTNIDLKGRRIINAGTSVGPADYVTSAELRLATTSPLVVAGLGITDAAFRTGPLSQFAATTSLQLKGVISDETGSGALVFAVGPTLEAPILGVATGTRLTLSGETVTTSLPVMNIAQTWNAAGVTFTGLKLNVTSTASAAGSLLVDLQVGGASKFQVKKTGQVLVEDGSESAPSIGFLNHSEPGIFRPAISANLAFAAGGVNSVQITSLGLLIVGYLGLGATFAEDVRLYRDAAGVLAQRVGTAAQAFRLYKTFTDTSNHERLGLTWASDILRIGTANAGTGTARVLTLDYGGTTTAAISVPITSGIVTLGGGIAIPGSIGLTTTQSTVNGSVSGTSIFSQVCDGSSFKKVVIYLTALLGTASYTFPVAFTNTPVIMTTSGLAAAIVTALSTTAVTVTGAPTTGFLFIEGY